MKFKVVILLLVVSLLGNLWQGQQLAVSNEVDDGVLVEAEKIEELEGDVEFLRDKLRNINKLFVKVGETGVSNDEISAEREEMMANEAIIATAGEALGQLVIARTDAGTLFERGADEVSIAGIVTNPFDDKKAAVLLNVFNGENYLYRGLFVMNDGVFVKEAVAVPVGPPYFGWVSDVVWKDENVLTYRSNFADEFSEGGELKELDILD